MTRSPGYIDENEDHKKSQVAPNLKPCIDYGISELLERDSTSMTMCYQQAVKYDISVDPMIYLNGLGRLKLSFKIKEILRPTEETAPKWQRDLQSQGFAWIQRPVFIRGFPRWADNLQYGAEKTHGEYAGLRGKYEFANETLFLCKKDMPITKPVTIVPESRFTTFMVTFTSDHGGYSLVSKSEDFEGRFTMAANDECPDMTSFWLDGIEPCIRFDKPGGLFVALVCDMMWVDETSKLSVDVMTTRVEEMEEYLKDRSQNRVAVSNDQQDKFIMCKLSKYYVGLTIGHGGVTPTDGTKMLLCERTCSGTDFSSWIVCVKKEMRRRVGIERTCRESDCEDYGLYEQIDPDAHIVYESGRCFPLHTKLPFSQTEFLGEEWFQRKPDNVESKSLGWVHATWSGSAIILMPSTDAAGFLMKYILTIEDKIQQMKNACKAFLDSEDDGAVWWTQLCNAALINLDSQKSEPSDVDVVKTIIQTSRQMPEDISNNVLHRALEKWCQSSSDFTADDCQLLQAAEQRFAKSRLV